MEIIKRRFFLHCIHSVLTGYFSLFLLTFCYVFSNAQNYESHKLIEDAVIYYYDPEPSVEGVAGYSVNVASFKYPSFASLR